MRRMRASERPSPRTSAEGEKKIHAHRSGTARAQRQNALATGPTSARRTKIGAKAIAHAPASRQRKAAVEIGARATAYDSEPMMSEFFSALILLTLVVDPFGNVPLANAMLADVAPARRRRVILRECAIAFAILAAFMASGRSFLELMHLSETSLSIAGGVILFMIAIRMVFAHPDGAFGPERRGDGGDGGGGRGRGAPAALDGRARDAGGRAPDGADPHCDRRGDAPRRDAGVRARTAMSKAFTREGDEAPDEELDADEANPIPAGAKNYLTPAGWKRKRHELPWHVKTERPAGANVQA